MHLIKSIEFPCRKIEDLNAGLVVPVVMSRCDERVAVIGECKVANEAISQLDSIHFLNRISKLVLNKNGERFEMRKGTIGGLNVGRAVVQIHDLMMLDMCCDQCFARDRR